jgi:hypothetical protein
LGSFSLIPLAKSGCVSLALRPFPILTYHLCSFQRLVNTSSVFPCLWICLALAHGGPVTTFLCHGCCISIAGGQLELRSKLGFAEQDQTSTLCLMQTTVIPRFGRHVGKVYSLVKHVSRGGCFWRCNSQTLGQNAGKVAHTTTMPQQLAIFALDFSKLRVIKSFKLPLALNTKDVNDFGFHVVHVARSAGQITRQLLEFLAFGVHWDHVLHVQGVVFGIQGVSVEFLRDLLVDKVCLNHVAQGLQNVCLSSDGFGIANWTRWSIAWKDMWNVRVVPIAQIFDSLSIYSCENASF